MTERADRESFSSAAAVKATAAIVCLAAVITVMALLPSWVAVGAVVIAAGGFVVGALWVLLYMEFRGDR